MGAAFPAKVLLGDRRISSRFRPISTPCENLGKHASGTVVLGYTLSYLVVRRLPALNVLDLRLWLAEATA